MFSIVQNSWNPLVLELVKEVTVVGIVVDGGGNDGWSFRKDCADLVRRISLLTHLLEEIRKFRARPVDDAASATSDDVDVESSWLSDLVGALRAAKRLLSLAGNFHSKSTSHQPKWSMPKEYSRVVLPPTQDSISIANGDDVSLVDDTTNFKRLIGRKTEKANPKKKTSGKDVGEYLTKKMKVIEDLQEQEKESPHQSGKGSIGRFEG
ncbi:hypothetical protein SO802_009787 [Lithocarpus litseifolius]|uniref:PUB 12/19-like N-terminal domain-containing protein n=1 Tax=Lithocarpus litseifolius TaxID=425828 RepID=A0AAW2DG67_9ROSI